MRRYERSGLTVARFCEREGVSVPSFYEWRKRFASLPAAAPAFRQLMLAPSGGVMSIDLAGGARIQLPGENLPLVRAVVAELLAAERGRSRGDA